MSTIVGTFTVEDSFRITDLGLVLVGTLSGRVASGHQVVFNNATRWRIKSVNFTNLRNQHEKLSLAVDAPLATREELVQRGIIGAAAQVVAP